jgi:MFS family permease
MATKDSRFRSLRVRNYRLYWSGQLVSQLGNWLSLTAMSWMVLTDLGGSAADVGWLAAAQFLPTLLFGTWGGLVADRVDLRRMLILTQSAFLASATVTAVLVSTGEIRLWMVYPLLALRGLVAAFDNPTRQAFVSELVGPDQIPNAVALNSAGFNSARIIGPAIAGLLIQSVGIELCFALNAASYTAAIGAQIAIRRKELHPRDPVHRAKGQIREGLSYSMRTPTVKRALITMAVVGTVSMNFTVLVPLYARSTFATSAGLFGLFSTAMGVGSLIGSLRAAGVTEPTLSRIGKASLALGASMLAAALAPTPVLAMAALVFAGASVMTFLASTNSVLQLHSDPEMRGRVLSLYLTLFIGTSPVGSPLVGWIAERAGTRWAFVYGGIGALAGGLLAIGRSRERASLTSPVRDQSDTGG